MCGKLRHLKPNYHNLHNLCNSSAQRNLGRSFFLDTKLHCQRNKHPKNCECMSLTPLILLGLKFSSNFEECTSVKNAQVLSTQWVCQSFGNILCPFDPTSGSGRNCSSHVMLDFWRMWLSNILLYIWSEQSIPDGRRNCSSTPPRGKYC